MNPDQRPDPENLEEIFDLGTLIHACLLEPHKADKTHKEYELAVTMSKTVMKDDLCRRIIMMPDFRSEHEFYRYNVHGTKGRCKMDGSSKKLSAVLEYKGLGVTTDNAFEEAIYNFDYDQGAAWYLDTSKYKHCLIAAVSKKDPRRIFKRIIDREHKIYRSGLYKINRIIGDWKQLEQAYQ